MEKTIVLKTDSKKQSLLFLTSITLERIAFNGFQVLLVLYLVSSSFEMTRSETIYLYSYFLSSLFLTKIIGALVGDRFLGNRKTMLIGGIFQTIGAFLLCIPSLYGMYTALFFLVLGSGFYSPNLIANFGKLHLNQPKQLDAQFTLLYLVTNIGSFIGVITIAILAETFSFNLAFIVIGVLFLLSFFTITKTNKEQNIQLENYSSPKNKRIHYITFAFLLFTLLYAFLNLITHVLIDRRLHFYEQLSVSISEDWWSHIDYTFVILSSLILYFWWSKCYSNRIYKIATAFIFAGLTFLLIGFFLNDSSQNYVTGFILCLFFLKVSETITTPLIYSLLTQYTNTKHLASFISISFIPSILASILIIPFQDFFYESNLVYLPILTASTLILGVLLLIIKFRKRKKPI